jgi:hypothetical protein
MTENEWNEIELVVIKDLEGKIDGLEREHFHVVVEWLRKNSHLIPQVKELIEASENLTKAWSMQKPIPKTAIIFKTSWRKFNEALAKFKAGEK